MKKILGLLVSVLLLGFLSYFVPSNVVYAETNYRAVSVKCNCTGNFSACGNYFGQTNVQRRSCAKVANGNQTCTVATANPVTFWQVAACVTDPTATPIISGTPAPTGNPNCKCSAQGNCTTQCQFNKFTDIATYSNPIKCGLPNGRFQSVPTANQKNDWCRSEMRTKGDADGNGRAALRDYFYYVAAVHGDKIPPTVNPDFNGDNMVNGKDRAIIIKSLKDN